ncbi:hypothetical protein [Actinophytocola sp.]|uniref:PepSY domain-containing protein n=1 Tax=Actinophytocola sp. TaxID=1872138 RepID=UPI002ED0A462
MKRVIIVGAVAAGIAIGGAGLALAAGQQDNDTGDVGDRPISGPALEKAERAALAHTHGGRVTETEVGDEEGYYEVEVTLADGRQVDVHLDADFHVLSTMQDTEADTDEGR